MSFEIVLDGGVATVLAVAGLTARAHAHASLTSAITAASGDLVLAAAEATYAGNDIALTIIDPDASGATLRVEVSAHDIFVYCATDASGAITTTAALAAAAMEANAACKALVTTNVQTGGSGLLNAMPREHLTGGITAGIIPTGGKFRVWAFDATNATILPALGASPDWYTADDDCSVAISALVTACTAPS